MVGELVSAAGHRPILAHDGESALAVARREGPDAIVLDVMMDGIDGYEVCRRLKTHRETNLTPVIMLTALSRDEDRVRGIRVGANFYLTKPCQPDALLRSIEKAFQWAEHMNERAVRGRVTLTIESDLGYLDEVNDMLTGLFAHTDLPEDIVHKIKYAVLEMGHNAIEWGNKFKKDLSVTLAYTITDDELTFVIRDQGEGFDPDDLPHASHGDDPIAHMEIREKLGLREGGFGILLSKEFMDDVRYNETGNEVTLTRHLKPTRASADSA